MENYNACLNEHSWIRGHSRFKWVATWQANTASILFVPLAMSFQSHPRIMEGRVSISSPLSPADDLEAYLFLTLGVIVTHDDMLGLIV